MISIRSISLKIADEELEIGDLPGDLYSLIPKLY
jgi:hypothetical protein